jgi:hypothetical protein
VTGQTFCFRRGETSQITMAKGPAHLTHRSPANVGTDSPAGPFATLLSPSTNAQCKQPPASPASQRKFAKGPRLRLAADLPLNQRRWPPPPSAPPPPRAASYASPRLPRLRSPPPPTPLPLRRRCCARSPPSQVLPRSSSR